ncbi:glycosyltransferase [Spongiivirga citrea]|uniref:Glycosyltransferase n=1 Tax=Spongiivirga citrea TaxID=1481457 RepID=A0A6M0CEQ6_9FLAO|nr:glycosyltransferase [Spongiivirga citrea]NER16241.1 glycosyltransferase [Spongiivirga citrea]
MKKGLFISGHQTTFITQDFELLKKYFKMRQYQMKMPKNPIFLFWELFKSFWYCLFNLGKFDFVFCWFADYHGFWPLFFAKLYGKQSYLVIGGFDADKNPEFNYGAHIKPWRSYFIRKIALLAKKVLPVSQYTAALTQENLGEKVFNKSEVIYNGVAVESIIEVESERAGFITIYKVEDLRRLKIKGADFLVEVAKAFPDEHFMVVGPFGRAAQYLKSFELENLEILPPTNHNELLKLLQTKKHYLQFSYIESFGIALVEGILSGCIPIGYGIETTKEIINTDALVFDKLTIEAFEKTLQNALENGTEYLPKIQEHCKSNYDITIRENQLLELIDVD